VRGIWFLPTGAYFCARTAAVRFGMSIPRALSTFFERLALEHACRRRHVVLESFEFRVSECRAVTMDREGNLLITENDSGYIRKVQFLRHGP
jgi:hypothetical protein